MTLDKRPVHSEDDFWRMRSFLREVFVLNGRHPHSWHVARLDYWRWHLILNCQSCGPVEEVTTLWETADGQLAALLHPICHDEIRLHVHPHFRSPDLEDEMLSHAETHHSHVRTLYVPVFSDDALRQQVLTRRGWRQQPGWGHHWQRELDAPIPDAPVGPEYTIRSMGTLDEHPARSWASWRAFHTDEPDENYDGDWSWYQNIQSAPLYRRDLDIVAATPLGEIAAFCTIFYDDATRSAVCVLVGTATEHWRRGLGKAVMAEGMRRLQQMGCTLVSATANDPPANALYRSVMQTMEVTDTWAREWAPETAQG